MCMCDLVLLMIGVWLIVWSFLAESAELRRREKEDREP